MDFVPFIVETFGALGPAALAFLSQLSIQARDHVGAWSHYDIVVGLRQAIAIAVQTDNANIVHASWTKAVGLDTDSR